MQTDAVTHSEGVAGLRIFGVGDTGISALELLMADGLSPDLFVALNTGATALENSRAPQKINLECRRLRGLGSGGDPGRARLAIEENADKLKALCENLQMVFIMAGLGGGCGTGASPALARIAKSAGALVLGCVTTPFECEGSHRQSLAERGLEELREAADGVICLPNQKLFQLIEENTRVVDTFRISNRFLADGLQGIWRALALKGLIQIHAEALVRLLQDQHVECSFAVAQASGADRGGKVIEKLLAHPMLDNGEAFAGCGAVLVSLAGGSDLTMAEVNRVMDQVKTRCDSAQVLMGAGIDPALQDRLAVTIIVAKKAPQEVAPRAAESLETQLLHRGAAAKPNSRLLPPAPELPPEQMKQILARQAGSRSLGRRASLKMRQAQLPLEIVSKGRFDKSEPTIHKGEDLDVPTYLRRGVSLN